jgi:hypothetical protein
MNHYMMIHRLRFPAILLLAGVIGWLYQLGVLDHFWHWFVPLVLISLGVIMLAERAALATGGYPQGQYPGQPYTIPGTGSVVGSNLNGAPQAPAAEGSASTQDFAQNSGKDPEGGQS